MGILKFKNSTALIVLALLQTCSVYPYANPSSLQTQNSTTNSQPDSFKSRFFTGMTVIAGVAGGVIGFVVADIINQKITRLSCSEVHLHGSCYDKLMYLTITGFGVTAGAKGMQILLDYLDTDNHNSSNATYNN